ncbi:transposase [Streptomyces sp. NBC_00868]|uniref:transposase n=1 Tax=unclassified Streptomyces TaxID=2593676 RepID=UPI003243C88E|nr:transposase [Streptomyces sp. NBC_00868]
MDDDVWALIEPLLPPWPTRSPGPRPVADRLCLQGILYVLCNDIAWQLLPPELGFGSGQTCWRRLERWQQAGFFDQLHRILLAELNASGRLDWSRACVDGSHIRAKKRGRRHRSVAGRPAEDGRAAETLVAQPFRPAGVSGMRGRPVG